MPLYTYILSYKGQSHVTQGSHSNFRGFINTWMNIPSGAIPVLTPDLRNRLAQSAYRGEFVAVPNIQNVWRKSIDVGDGECTLIAVQTER